MTGKQGDAAQATAEKPLLFDAVLRPHRSLSPAGFVILMAVVAAVSFVAGLVFWSRGAWPVFGFFGLDVALIYGAFRLNYRSGRRYETVRLREDELIVHQVAPSGKVTEWRFQPYWLRVDLTAIGEDDNRLTFASHGRSVSVGSFLTPGERREFRDALVAALGRHATAV